MNEAKLDRRAVVAELLRDHGVPFRLHWGKEIPASSPGDEAWVELLAGRYPHWAQFLALRAATQPADDQLFGRGQQLERPDLGSLERGPQRRGGGVHRAADHAAERIGPD